MTDLMNREKGVGLLQYMLIYAVLVTGNSYLYSYFLEPYVGLFAIVLSVLVLVLPKYWHFRDVAFVVFILVDSLVLRCVTGGVGVSVFFRFAMTIFLIGIAISVDKRMFFTRLLRVVCLLATVGSVMYLVRVVWPGVYGALPLYEYSSQGEWYDVLIADHVSYRTKGVFLFCMREAEVRNIGIFTEPGVFQGVLTAMLFVLLFMGDKLVVGRKEKISALIALVLGVVTCGSTTGLLSLIVLVLLYLPASSHNGFANVEGLKRYVVLLGAFCIGILAFDYSVRGSDSILSYSFLNKLFVDTTNGEVRGDSLATALQILEVSPFGVGFDNVNSIKASTSVGAGLFVTTAALGIQFAVCYLIWLLVPVFRSKLGFCGICAYLFIYLNFVFSQSLILTPVLVSISVYYALMQEGAVSDDEGSLAVQHAD